MRDRLPAGLWGDGAVGNVLGDGPVAYEVTYADRGEQAVGPARVTVRDVLGLVARTFEVGGTDALTVYPRTTPLSPGGRNRLLAVVGSGDGPQRDEFDHLREYAAGDSLRDVNWKASARRDDLVVDEYTAADVAERVVVVAEADPDDAGGDDAGGDDAPSDGTAGTVSPADRMAEATASIALALLGAGVPVTVRTPTGTVAADVGDRAALLGHLARTTAGRVAEGPDTAVHVRATAAGVRVRLGDVETTFDDLRGDSAAAGNASTDHGPGTATEGRSDAEGAEGATGDELDDGVATEVAQ
ncbi:MAG: DUF58 domain-containing protein [Haloferacaceae archaeon]